MVHSISTTPPGKNIQAMDVVSQEQLSTPGYYSRRDLMMPATYPSQRRGGFLSFLGKIILVAAVICGGAVVARKTLLKDYDVVSEFGEDAKFLDKFKNFVAKSSDSLENGFKNLIKKQEKAD